jgi:CysZ protein
MKGRLDRGFNYLLQGFNLLTRPEIRPYVIIPLLINTVIFVVLIGATISQFSTWIEAAMDWLPGFLSFLRWVIWPFVVILLLTVVMYTFSVIANLIASPFNGLLAEKTEELLTGKPVAGYETITGAVMAFPKSITRELAKLLYYIPLALLVLIASFIPLINVAAPVLWFMLGAWMMAVQYCDFPMDNNRRTFAQMKRAIRNQRLTSSGFGASVMVGTMIPVVNLVIMPAAVCGATSYWVDELSRLKET